MLRLLHLFEKCAISTKKVDRCMDGADQEFASVGHQSLSGSVMMSILLGARSRTRVVSSVVVLTVVLAGLLSGCVAREGILTLGAEELATPCEITPLPVEIRVEDLDTDVPPSCEPVAAELVFPDGTRVLMDEHAATGSQQSGDGPQYTFTRVGIYGLFASYASVACDVREDWGSAEAKSRVYGAFGDDFGGPISDDNSAR